MTSKLSMLRLKISFSTKPKKDKNAKEIYKEIGQLKEDFDKLITNIQEQNKIRTQVRDLETKSEDFRIKYKNGVEI